MSTLHRPFQARAPWAHFNDYLCGVAFVDSVSAPVTIEEADELSAIGCVIEPVPLDDPDAPPASWDGIAPGPEDLAIAAREEALDRASEDASPPSFEAGSRRNAPNRAKANRRVNRKAV